MYQELHKWEESIQVAETKQHPEVATLKANYFQWLAETGQEEKAAESKEREGDLVTAIHLYLKGGLPARAAAVVTRYEGRTSFQPALLETVANALHSSSMFERAGAFYEQLNDPSRAMDSYRKGQAYGRAVELSRRCFQGREVVELEQLWGDHLVSLKKSDEAIAHFVEAGAALKAVEAAIQCRQWAKAAQVVETLDPTEARPYYQQIAKYYEGARNYDDAERFYLRAGLPQDVVEMYSKANKWGTPRDASRTGRLTHTQPHTSHPAPPSTTERAHRIATEHMSQAEVAMLYITQVTDAAPTGPPSKPHLTPPFPSPVHHPGPPPREQRQAEGGGAALRDGARARPRDQHVQEESPVRRHDPARDVVPQGPVDGDPPALGPAARD